MINASVRNWGSFSEVFNVTISANATVVASFADLLLASGEYATLSYVWNTTGFLGGNYSIEIFAPPVLEETSVADNAAWSWVFITIVGDVDHDFDVDVMDVVQITGAYGATPTSPYWNTHADIAKPFGKIDIFDVV